MKSIRTADGVVGKGIVHEPRSGDYRNVVIWMHGLGDTADGWASLMPELGLEHTKFILPTAPKRPISLKDGAEMNGWSDIYSLSSSDREDEIGFIESRERIHGIVKAEIDAGIEPSKVALSLHVVTDDSTACRLSDRRCTVGI
jgi:predicted esterase